MNRAGQMRKRRKRVEIILSKEDVELIIKESMKEKYPQAFPGEVELTGLNLNYSGVTCKHKKEVSE